MSTSQAELDADITALTAAVQACTTAFNSLAQKAAAASPPIDYTAEDTAVKAAIASLAQLSTPQPGS